MENAFELLHREWHRLGRSGSAARRLADVCEATGASTLADVERFVRAASPESADRVLVLLAARSVDGDALAARVLLQILLPGTRNLARRWWALGDEDERAAAAVAAVYQRIRCYPLERRPGRIAANVLMDAAYDLRRSVPSIALSYSAEIELVYDHGRGDNREQPHPAVELAELLTDALHDGLLTPEEAQLIARSRIGGQTIADLAVQRRQGTRTLWHRRRRAELRLVAAQAVPLANQGRDQAATRW